MRPEIADHITSLKPYVPGKPLEELERELGISGAIKLASNENPLGPSPLALKAMQAALATSQLYPDGAAFKLKERVAAYAGAQFEEIATGNGSNELLTLMVRTFCLQGDHAVIADHSFIAYRVIMQAAGVKWTSVPNVGDFQADVDAIIAAVKPGTRMVFLANPNNPTGTYITAPSLRRLLTEIPPEVIVVVDEAYHEYVQASDYASALSMRDVRENLIVARTFSKVFGLGGVRCGFMVGPSRLVDYVNRVREPFNCNTMAQVGARAALDDKDFIARSVKVNEEGRAIMEQGLAALADRHITWTPSQTNFLLVHLGDRDGEQIYDAMLREGVIVRPMRGYGLPNALRMTLGTPEQAQRCLKALEHALSH